MHDYDDHRYPDHHELDDENILEQKHLAWKTDRIALKSVGIDIGSTTSHLIISNIELRRQGWKLSSRFEVVKRETISQSDIMLTPFIGGTTIDREALSSFISEAYAKAKIKPEDIDTGVIITTGEAVKKENAEAIANLFSAEAGKFVCVSAGPNLEASLAAYGSAAVERSAGERNIVMNADIGGGTSKIAIVRKGEIVSTAVISVGARLIVLDRNRRIVRIEDAGRLVIEEAELDLNIGDKLQNKDEHKISRILANCIFELIERSDLSPLAEKLMITLPITFTGDINEVIFSGGVSEYIYRFENKDYGDLGITLADEIKKRAYQPESRIPVAQPTRGIRATVIGASQFTVQVSGNTIFISNEEILPLRNVQVLSLEVKNDNISPELVESTIQGALRRFDVDAGESLVALAIHWPLNPVYSQMKALSQGIVSALKRGVESGKPIILAFDTDVAKLIGNLLTRELSITCDVVSIDGIKLRNFEYIDIGKKLPDIQAVPVVIKSLVFNAK
ncbi:ethanolamine ammonia-lyase reactivating factor EutA [Chloroflexota bacterium]